MKFYVGLHQPSDAKHVERAFVSVNRLRHRWKPLACPDWIMDSGAFTELSQYGGYRHEVGEYAALIKRLGRINGNTLTAVVAQDYMCESFILQKTGLTIADHQRLTIERYDTLRNLVNVYVMPVLQGYEAADYIGHLQQYGDRLASGAYVGVGSVCKRNTSVGELEIIFSAIKRWRPDLCLHAFGLKSTALRSVLVRDQLASADSMAWSYSARKQGPGGRRNSYVVARNFASRIETMPMQTVMEFLY
jgi:hypothetical protein